MKPSVFAALVAAQWAKCHGMRPLRGQRGATFAPWPRQDHERDVHRYNEERKRMAGLLLLFPMVTP